MKGLIGLLIKGQAKVATQISRSKAHTLFMMCQYPPVPQHNSWLIGMHTESLGECWHAPSQPAEGLNPLQWEGLSCILLVSSPPTHVLVDSSKVQGLPHFDIVFTHIKDWLLGICLCNWLMTQEIFDLVDQQFRKHRYILVEKTSVSGWCWPLSWQLFPFYPLLLQAGSQTLALCVH